MLIIEFLMNFFCWRNPCSGAAAILRQTLLSIILSQSSFAPSVSSRVMQRNELSQCGSGGRGGGMFYLPYHFSYELLIALAIEGWQIFMSIWSTPCISELSIWSLKARMKILRNPNGSSGLIELGTSMTVGTGTSRLLGQWKEQKLFIWHEISKIYGALLSSIYVQFFCLL